MELQRRASTGVWIVLMAATILTTWVLAKDAVSARIGTVAIVLLAAIKVRLVLLHFMELRHAPTALRLVFEAWVLLVAAGILVLYLQAGAPISG